MPGDPMETEAPIAAPDSGSGNIEDAGSMNEKVAHLMAEIAKHPDMPMAEKKKRVLAAFNLLDDTSAPPVEEVPVDAAPVAPMEDDMDKEREEEKKEKEEEKKMEESIKKLKSSSDPAHKELAESIEKRLVALKDKRKELKLLEEAAQYKTAKAKARQLCEASALPKPLITDHLIESMAKRKDEKGMKAILEDRLAFVNVKQPTSAPGTQNAAFKHVKPGTSGRKEASDLTAFLESLNKK